MTSMNIEQLDEQMAAFTQKKECLTGYNKGMKVAVNDGPPEGENNINVWKQYANGLADQMIKVTKLAADAQGLDLEVSIKNG